MIIEHIIPPILVIKAVCIELIVAGSEFIMSLVFIVSNIKDKPTNVPKTPSNIHVDDEFFIDLIFSSIDLFLNLKPVQISSIKVAIFISA
ncbi:hypothetical protein SDC9_156683 [bioreactor metagenome]|uniref:Uncharacterized protein n=1 Tax=bioreactor metagenome TaxID=1076179 RepID=A0A645FAA3_9ZZZZ